MRTAHRLTTLALTVTLACAVGTAAAESDLWVTVEGPSAVRFGDEATYTVHYGNIGPDTATDVYVSLDMPPGIPAPFPDITTDQRDAIAASAAGTDTFGNLPLLFDDDHRWCDSLLLQLQGPHDDQSATPIAPLVPGDEGSFSVTVTFPMALPPIGGLWVDAPTELAGEITNLGRGSCDDCSDLEAYCFGEPLPFFDLGSLPAKLADDGSSPDPTLGCNPQIGSYSGRIALIRRGSCQFAAKVANAEGAGAAGVVIVNNGQCGDAPPSADCVIDLLEGNLLDTSIPAVMVSQNEGEPLIAALEAGRDVRFTLGALPTRDPAFEATIFQWPTQDTDPVPANNRNMAITSINRLPVGAPVRRAPGGRVGG